MIDETTWICLLKYSAYYFNDDQKAVEMQVHESMCEM